MHQKIIFALIALFLIFTPRTIFARSQFTPSYELTYDVDFSGETAVSENVSLKNLTDRFYASSFNITIPATDIHDIVAGDSQGKLTVTTSTQTSKTQIKINFNQQITGKDKTYSFNLKYKSKDFADKQGKIWQVYIPKLNPADPIEDYDLILSVPVGFGDPSSILPEPISENETGGKLNLKFNKGQISDFGVLANFGSEQVYSFTLNYNLKNSSFLPTISKIPIPPTNSFQQVEIQNIDPKPENVTLDEDGNYLAWYKLDRKSALNISVSGFAKLSSNPKEHTKLNQEQLNSLTRSDNFWEKDNPLIRAKLAEIFKDQNPPAIEQKAKLINQYVVNFLKFNEHSSDRLGALTILNNPDNATCLEFSDLFIALARSVDVSARELFGYSYSNNQTLRPLSLQKNSLHCWVEYFDSNKGWVMIDPTWQNTTGGVDYFHKMDLNHFVIATKGVSSSLPNLPTQVNFKFSEAEVRPSPKLIITIDSPSEIFAGFPAKLKVRVENQGSSIQNATKIAVSSSKIDIAAEGTGNIYSIPPFGHVQFEYNLRPTSLWNSYEDILQVSVANQNLVRKITVKPFFSYQYFPYIVGLIIIVMILFYIGVFYLHHKSRTPTGKNRP